MWLLDEIGLPFQLTLASARLGPGSEHLCASSGLAPFGVVGTAEYAEMNPHQKIPTLMDPNDCDKEPAVMWESHTILRYLAGKYEPGFFGGTSAGLARSSMWMDWVLHGFDYAPCFGSANHHLIDAVARTPPAERDGPRIAAAAAQCECTVVLD